MNSPEDFNKYISPSRLILDQEVKIILKDLGNLEIRLPCSEKLLYVLFLRHPEGIYLSSLNEYRQELYEIYIRISTRGLMEDMRRRIDDMTNITRDQISVKLSRIKRAFTDAIGQSLADYYIMQGENAERRRIKLDRSLVIDLAN